jgi:hypothetical protein
VRLSHDLPKTHVSFDDPNLVSRAGLVPVMALAEKAGLSGLVGEHLSTGGPCGVNGHLKAGCLVAGMAAGADSIDDLDVLRHGAMSELFTGIRAPSTLAREAVSAARQAGCSGRLVVRIDSAYHSAAVLGAIRSAEACFCVTVPLRRNIRTAIASIPGDAWTPITYPRAIWDEDQQRLLSAPRSPSCLIPRSQGRRKAARSPPG